MSLLLLLSSESGPSAPTAVVLKWASMLERLLPPGKLWDLLSGLLSQLLIGCADELGRLDARVIDLLNEADPTIAFDLLPEFESELELVSAASIPERRANIVALLVRRQRFRPEDFQVALAPLLAQDPEDVVIIERTRAFCIAVEDDREIDRFFVYRDPTLPGTYFLSSAQSMVDRMAPSHTVGTVIESTSMMYDDPYSLYDRDLLGA